ncbi:MAG: ABC transporter permease [Planctomycetes bacterium]|nr:ABC transporter permease [Planctomycetota bacterium]
MASAATVFWLGLKELRELSRDVVLVVFVAYAFTLAVFSQARGTSSEVHNASIAFVDDDRSALSRRLAAAFLPPRFQPPRELAAADIERALDAGRFMFVVVIPPRFEADLRAGRRTELQIDIDATAMFQASSGASFIERILTDEVTRELQRSDEALDLPLRLVVRKAFNPNGDVVWFNAIVALVNQITLLAVTLTGAALIREREHGTLEHLLAMPVTAFEIALAKVWANGLVILVAAAFSVSAVVRGVLAVPTAGSVPLFLAGVAIYLFFATALGIFLGTVSRTMAQFGLLVILTVFTLQMLSGGNTPVESQPEWLERLTLVLPSRHFVSFAQAILFRGAGFDLVWREFAAVAAIGTAFLLYAVSRFRASIAVGR